MFMQRRLKKKNCLGSKVVNKGCKLQLLRFNPLLHKCTMRSVNLAQSMHSHTSRKCDITDTICVFANLAMNYETRSPILYNILSFVTKCIFFWIWWVIHSGWGIQPIRRCLSNFCVLILLLLNLWIFDEIDLMNKDVG